MEADPRYYSVLFQRFFPEMSATLGSPSQDSAMDYYSEKPRADPEVFKDEFVSTLNEELKRKPLYPWRDPQVFSEDLDGATKKEMENFQGFADERIRALPGVAARAL